MPVNFLQNLQSFAAPLVLETRESSLGPTLEAILYEGKLSINTHYVNYSYGNLLAAFSEVLGLMGLPAVFAPKSVLILGLGAGSVAEWLLEQLPSSTVVGIELDPVVLYMGRRWGNLSALEKGGRLTVHQLDAFAWLPHAPRQAFELIIVDLFVESFVPPAAGSSGFFVQLDACLASGGRILLNRMIDDPHHASESRLAWQQCQAKFPHARQHRWGEANVFYEAFR
jgi:spermidine synthase